MPAAPRLRPEVALAVVSLCALAALAWIASPLWVGLMLGTVMAFTGAPLSHVLTRRLQRPRLAAVLTTIVGGIVVAGSTTAAVYVLGEQLLSAIELAQRAFHDNWLAEHLGPRTTKLVEQVVGDPRAATEHVRAELGRLSAYAARAAGLVVEAATGALVVLVIALATMYFVLHDGARVTQQLERLLPLQPRDTRALVREFRKVGRGAFVASLLCAVVQGVLAWLGFLIGGVPRAATWGALLAVLSFVPVIGTALVWVPVGAFQIATHHLGGGLFVFAWSALVVMAGTDYLIRPVLVGSGGNNHPLLTLVSLLGGIHLFGLPGLIAGPVVVSLSMAVLRIYAAERARRPGPGTSDDAPLAPRHAPQAGGMTGTSHAEAAK
jgi:predicted PurR-regulated permease PerM